MADDAIYYEPLTDRELDIVRLKVDRQSNQQIADTLFLSLNTVKWYNQQIYGKLYVRNRRELIERVEELQLLAEHKPEVDASPTLSLRQLPRKLTSFIGREQEIIAISARLHETRLLTLTGPGGTGKTRLSLEVAQQVKDNFADEVVFVDLTPIQDASKVVDTIATALGLLETASEPMMDKLCRVLETHKLLLIIDNFEHVLAGANIVSELLQRTQHIKVIVTSREALRLYGEHEYHVPTLSLPENLDTMPEEDLQNNDAVQLFIQRAQTVNRRFKSNNIRDIAKICARLDGLPLAIELAAARVKILNPQALLARLNNRLDVLTAGASNLPQRQRTIRDTIAWSYDLLDDDEKRLFMRLSVFRGGRSIEAVEAVCMGGLALDVLDGLASLVDKSLVIQREDALDEPRFWMLETIQDYAYERLSESGDLQRCLSSHAMYFMELAETAEPELRRHNQQYWLKRLEIELPNIRGGLHHTLSEGNAEIGGRLFVALSDVWWYGVHHEEAERWGHSVLKHAENISPALRGRVYFVVGYCHWILRHDYDITYTYSKQAYDIGIEIDDKWLTAIALRYMGGSHIARPKDTLTPELLETARGYIKQSVDLLHDIGDKGQQAHSLNSLAELYGMSDEYEQAIEYYIECITLARQIGDMFRVAINLSNLSHAYRMVGKPLESIQVARDGLLIARDRNDVLLIQHLLQVITPPNQARKTTRLLYVSDRILQQQGGTRQPRSLQHFNGRVQLMREQLGEVEFDKAWQEGEQLSFDEAIAYALDEIDPFDKS